MKVDSTLRDKSATAVTLVDEETTSSTTSTTTSTTTSSTTSSTTSTTTSTTTSSTTSTTTSTTTSMTTNRASELHDRARLLQQSQAKSGASGWSFKEASLGLHLGSALWLLALTGVSTYFVGAQALLWARIDILRRARSPPVDV